MEIVTLPIRNWVNGEEHFQISYFFDDSKSYEIAVSDLTYGRKFNDTNIVEISTNILEYNVLNPKNIIHRFSYNKKYQISPMVYYKIDAGSLENLRLKLTNFRSQPLAINLSIREING